MRCPRQGHIYTQPVLRKKDLRFYIKDLNVITFSQKRMGKEFTYEKFKKNSFQYMTAVWTPQLRTLIESDDLLAALSLAEPLVTMEYETVLTGGAILEPDLALKVR